MRRIVAFLGLILACGASSAQTNYDASLIPKELLPYASAVVRNEEITVRVNDLNDVVYHVKRVITVLNSNGDDKARLYVYYDKLTSVRSIKGLVYDEHGKVVRKISSSDFEDEAVTDGFSLFLDDRVKHYNKAITDYPYTIEFEYEVKSKQSLNFPEWTPSPESGLAVEHSSYTFACQPDYVIHYKEINTPSKVETGKTADGLKTYAWHIEHIKARRYEPLSPAFGAGVCRVLIAPEKFTYDSFAGSFTDWQQLGKWEYDKLLADRTDVPEQTVLYIKSLTANIADPKLKAKKIYEYMQQKTHYISIQIGIGGYRPFPASDVDKDGYGDCKALVNYTRSLLKIAGIESWYCIVEAGREHKVGMMHDFASMQGNHAILCVPFKNDTTWLECTSQQIPFGFLSDFTDDRTVLACTPEGGKLIHTPKYTTEENLEQRKADFVISEAGDLQGHMETVFKGTDYDDRYVIIEKNQAERLKDIRKYYPINNLDVKSLEYKQDKSTKPATFENIRLTAREYGAPTDGKFYFSLNSFDRFNAAPKQVRNRENPVYINRGHTEEDDITFTLPKGYKLDSEPLNVDIDKPFGSYKATMTIKDGQLIYTRKFQIKDGTYDKDMYQDVVDFYQSVVDADNYNVTLVKN